MNERTAQELGAQALELIPLLRIKKAHERIAERLAVGQWAEAIELASMTRDIGAKAPRAILAELLDSPRTPATRATAFRAAICELVDMSERGETVPRDELQTLADEHGLEPIACTISAPRAKREPPPRARASGRPKSAVAPSSGGGRPPIEEDARDPLEHPAPALVDTAPPRVIIVSPRDLDRRREALAELTEHLREEHPPPVIERERQGRKTLIISPESRAEAIAWIDKIARAWPAPLNVGDLSQISGGTIAPRILAELLRERTALSSQGLTEERRRSIALAMLDEAEGVAREALALAAGGADERTRAMGLKLALDSIATRSRLAGLDKLTLEVTTSAGDGATWEERAASQGLDADTLAKIGDLASRALSGRTNDD